jgi:hypothetical protein
MLMVSNCWRSRYGVAELGVEEEDELEAVDVGDENVTVACVTELYRKVCGCF